MDNNNLQLGFSKLYGASVLDRESRKQKAQKALAILDDRLSDISHLDALDIGCSAGNSTIWYAQRFQQVVGVDIDAAAVGHAYRHNRAPNIDVPGSLKQKFSLLLLKTAYGLCPTYLWLLIKTK